MGIQLSLHVSVSDHYVHVCSVSILSKVATSKNALHISIQPFPLSLKKSSKICDSKPSLFFLILFNFYYFLYLNFNTRQHNYHQIANEC